MTDSEQASETHSEAPQILETGKDLSDTPKIEPAQSEGAKSTTYVVPLTCEESVPNRTWNIFDVKGERVAAVEHLLTNGGEYELRLLFAGGRNAKVRFPVTDNDGACNGMEKALAFATLMWQRHVLTLAAWLNDRLKFVRESE